MSTPLLEIEDLHARVAGREIIKGFNLTINEGEVHAIMGPNGAGKSTLSYLLSGKPGYEVTSGTVKFRGRDLLAMPAEDRAREGVFLIMQYPVEIPGVPVTSFLKHAVNAVRKYHNQPELDTMEFVKMVREEGRKLGIDAEMLKRPVNVGFSGGEKKRLETLQMAVSKPICGLTSSPCKWWPKGASLFATAAVRCSSSPITSGCSTTLCPISFMCLPTGTSSNPATKIWRWSWKKKATPNL